VAVKSFIAPKELKPVKSHSIWNSRRYRPRPRVRAVRRRAAQGSSAGGVVTSIAKRLPKVTTRQQFARRRPRLCGPEPFRNATPILPPRWRMRPHDSVPRGLNRPNHGRGKCTPEARSPAMLAALKRRRKDEVGARFSAVLPSEPTIASPQPLDAYGG